MDAQILLLAMAVVHRRVYVARVSQSIGGSVTCRCRCPWLLARPPRTLPYRLHLAAQLLLLPLLLQVPSSSLAVMVVVLLLLHPPPLEVLGVFGGVRSDLAI